MELFGSVAGIIQPRYELLDEYIGTEVENRAGAALTGAETSMNVSIPITDILTPVVLSGMGISNVSGTIKITGSGNRNQDYNYSCQYNLSYDYDSKGDVSSSMGGNERIFAKLNFNRTDTRDRDVDAYYKSNRNFSQSGQAVYALENYCGTGTVTFNYKRTETKSPATNWEGITEYPSAGAGITAYKLDGTKTAGRVLTKEEVTSML
jgi:hypothetical protein